VGWHGEQALCKETASVAHRGHPRGRQLGHHPIQGITQYRASVSSRQPTLHNLRCNPAPQPAGQEIWEQTGGRVDAFVSGAGTGGTIAGVSCYLKQRRPEVQVFLIDPPGSSLYNKVRHFWLLGW